MATAMWKLAILLALIGFLDATSNHDIPQDDDYYGIFLGRLSGSESISPYSSDYVTAASIKGTLYCVDETTIFVNEFFLEDWFENIYIGFYAVQFNDVTELNENETFALKTALTIGTGRNTSLLERGYGGENFLLKFPDDSQVTDFDGIVMLRHFTTPLSELVDIPRGLHPPQPYPLGEFQSPVGRPIHGVHADSAVVLNTRQIALYNFNYDGNAPRVFFWVGTGRVDRNGIKATGPDGSDRVSRHRNDTITVTLPSNTGIFDIGYLALWEELFIIDLGHVLFNLTGKIVPPYFDDDTFVAVPPIIPVNVIPLYNQFRLTDSYGVHAEGIYALNTKQILLQEFSYNGECPEAYFWVGVFNDMKDGRLYVDEIYDDVYRVQRLPSPNGDRDTPLVSYHLTNITLTLQGDITVYDMGFLGLWCDSFEQPKEVAFAFLLQNRKEKYVGRLPVYTGEESGLTETELERVLNYAAEIWRNLLSVFSRYYA